jgi:hypothetical protein
VVTRLVLDQIWRNRWFYAVVTAFLIPLWVAFAATSANPVLINKTTASLFFASVLGPVITVATMGIRELRHLPVTNRDLWRATWILAIVVSPVVLLATKLMSALLVAAFGGSQQMSIEAMLLWAVYDVSWSGTVLVIVTLAAYVGAAVARHRTVAAPVTTAATIVVPMVCIGLPIIVSSALPARVSEFTSATTTTLIACLAITFGALVWTPRRGMLAGERPRSSRAVARPRATRTRLVDHLTGLSRVVVPHLVGTVALTAGSCLVLVAYGVISGSGPWWFVPPTPEVFDPRDVGYRGLTYYVLLPCGVVSMLGLWTPWARLLRVLPLSVRQINALLLLTPFATWTTLWLIGVAGYSVIYGTPPTFRVSLVFGMAGVAALAHAGLLRLQEGTGAFWIRAFIGGLMPMAAKAGVSDRPGVRIAFALAGTFAICLAAGINHHTLTQSTSSSRAYRRPQAPFGFPSTHGTR